MFGFFVQILVADPLFRHQREAQIESPSLPRLYRLREDAPEALEREEKMMPLPLKNELLPSRSARVWLQILKVNDCENRSGIYMNFLEIS